LLYIRHIEAVPIGFKGLELGHLHLSMRTFASLSRSASLTSYLQPVRPAFDVEVAHVIGVLRGEGVGSEIVTVALDLLDILARHTSRRFVLREGGDIGLPAKAACGRCLSPQVADFAEEIFAENGVLFCGPGGDRFVYELRKHFDLYCKFTPIQPLMELQEAGVLKPNILNDVDILAIRDNLEGIYQGSWETSRDDAGQRTARHAFHYSEPVVTRLMMVALRAASLRRRRLHVILKPGGVPSISSLWRACYGELAGQFDVEVIEQEIDNAVYQLITNPRQFDVIVSPNLFGDVIADCAASLLASRGLSYSGNFNSTGHAAYQTGHGAARDIAGLNLANPTAQIFALAMMLRESFDWPEGADKLVDAVRTTLAMRLCTADVAAPGCRILGTEEFGKAVAENLSASLRGESS
jgi:3-isopropylmalate dehydrogenase